MASPGKPGTPTSATPVPGKVPATGGSVGSSATGMGAAPAMPLTSAPVVLTSSDLKEFRVTYEAASLSTLLKTMLDDCAPGESIPVATVTSATLEKVVEYCEYHKNNPPEEIPKPLKSPNLAEVVSDWDLHYVQVSHDLLFDLIKAANYLDIKPLLELTCAKVASMIKGKTTEEIRAKFNIENDFTPEEEAQIREENRWCEEA